MAISGNVLWCLQNFFDNASLSSNAAMSLPLSNLQDRRRRVRARFSATSSVQLTIDLGNPQAVQCIAFCGSNMQYGATVQVHDSTDNFSSNDVTLDTLTVITPPSIVNGITAEYVHFFAFPAVSSRYWRLILNDAGNPDGYLTLGRVYVGPTLEMSRNISSALQVRVVDQSRTDVSPGGVPYTDQQAPWREVLFDYRLLQDVDLWGNFMDVVQQVGTRTSLWLLLQPSILPPVKYQAAFYGRFSQIPGLTHIGNSYWNASQAVFAEDL